MPTVSRILQKTSSTPQSEDLKTFEVPKNEVLFDALDDQGETLPHGCLSGSCGSCRIIVIEGEQNLSDPGAVELDTLNSLSKDLSAEIEKVRKEYPQAKLRLSCRAKVLGDIKFWPL